MSGKRGNILTNTNYYYGQNVCRLVHILPQFLFNTSEVELGYYHQKMNA